MPLVSVSGGAFASCAREILGLTLVGTGITEGRWIVGWEESK